MNESFNLINALSVVLFKTDNLRSDYNCSPIDCLNNYFIVGIRLKEIPHVRQALEI